MPPITLDGDTLGKKHRYYNKLVDETIANKTYELSKIKSDDSDIDNLLKIDIASKTRNVDFIIEALKSDDMLLVSKAIKTSTWLITDQQYAHIINPEYLHTQLFPSMNTKAINKLMLHIRLNLKEEARVEAFYDYLKGTKDGYKWLQNCSLLFIENILKGDNCITLALFERLCRRSIIFLKYYTKVDSQYKYVVKKKILYLLNAHTTEVLNVLEDNQNNHNAIPHITKRYAKIIMKRFPQRILDNFEIYLGNIDLSVVAKYLKKEDIKAFLYKQVQNDKIKRHFTNYNNLKHFIQNMPADERFDFIKKTFIDKTPNEGELLCSGEAKNPISCTMESFYWYKYAPFNIAFTDLKKLIRAEKSSAERCTMLSLLITCARGNPRDIKTLLKFYYDKHINEPFKFKVQFVNKLLTDIATHELDSETWNILDQLFHSMDVYTESDNNVQMCLQAIVLYNVLHGKNVPDIVEKKLIFDTFTNYKHKLDQEQQEKIFSYLFSSICNKIQKQNTTNESEFFESIKLLKNVLSLLKDWKKDINNYSIVLEKIRELIKIQKEKSFQNKLSFLYNIKKSWRKYMFRESLSLSLKEETCLNALKHEPQLLMHYENEVDTLRTNDALSLRRLLAKLRVYWPESLAQQWIEAYSQKLNQPTGQKAVIRGLIMLMPQKEIINMAKEHAPEDFKINWGETDQAKICLRRNIAQQLHLSRPLIPLDTVLWYAKGDYLQYAVPSLNAVLHYLSKNQSRKYLPKLLDAPVSLQKFGLHLAFVKLKPEELKAIFSKIWITTKNSTIRAVLFTHTYDALCKAKNPTIEKELWQSLSIFIDNLSSDESKEIYINMSKVQNVPLNIRAEFYKKSFEFFASSPTIAICETYVNELLREGPDMMDLLDADFVADKLLSPVQIRFKRDAIELYSSYVLCGKTEEEQLHRYRRVLVPAMEYAFESWDYVTGKEYYTKEIFFQLLRSLIWNFRKFVTLNKIPIPTKLFIEIKNKMEERMTLDENYVRYTTWKLVVEYVKLVDEHKDLLTAFKTGKFLQSSIRNHWMPDDIEDEWKQMHFKISPMFGSVIVEILKEDTEKYFPSIWRLFQEALDNMFEDMSFQRYVFTLETLKYMLHDENCISSFIIVCKMIPKYGDEEVIQRRAILRNKISSHPSREVQMHYHNFFGDMPE